MFSMKNIVVHFHYLSLRKTHIKKESKLFKFLLVSTIKTKKQRLEMIVQRRILLLYAAREGLLDWRWVLSMTETRMSGLKLFQ